MTAASAPAATPAPAAPTAPASNATPAASAPNPIPASAISILAVKCQHDQSVQSDAD